jgi:hypothetical protein
VERLIDAAVMVVAVVVPALRSKFRQETVHARLRELNGVKSRLNKYRNFVTRR